MTMGLQTPTATDAATAVEAIEQMLVAVFPQEMRWYPQKRGSQDRRQALLDQTPSWTELGGTPPHYRSVFVNFAESITAVGLMNPAIANRSAQEASDALTLCDLWVYPITKYSYEDRADPTDPLVVKHSAPRGWHATLQFSPFAPKIRSLELELAQEINVKYQEAQEQTRAVDEPFKQVAADNGWGYPDPRTFRTFAGVERPYYYDSEGNLVLAQRVRSVVFS